MSLGLLLAAWLALAVLPGAAGAHHVHAPCDEAAQPVPFAAGLEGMENLHFLDGVLYATGGRILAFDTSGEAATVADFGTGTGAMVTGRDSALLVRVNPGEIRRFADLPSASYDVVASGLAGANGLAIDAAGNLYVSSWTRNVVYRVPAEDPGAWTRWAEIHSPNGLVVDDDKGILYVAETNDGRSTILAVPLEDPSRAEPVAFLSFGFLQADYPYAQADRPPSARVVDPSDPTLPLVPKALDDLTLGPDGRIYVAGWATGEILRVDLDTGAACAVADGIPNPTSVRVARGFGAFDGDLFVTYHGGPGAALPGAPPEAPRPDPGLRGGVVRVPLGLGIDAASPPPRGPDPGDAGAEAEPGGRGVPAVGALALLVAAAVALRLRR